MKIRQKIWCETCDPTAAAADVLPLDQDERARVVKLWMDRHSAHGAVRVHDVDDVSTGGVVDGRCPFVFDDGTSPLRRCVRRAGHLGDHAPEWTPAVAWTERDRCPFVFDTSGPRRRCVRQAGHLGNHALEWTAPGARALDAAEAAPCPSREPETGIRCQVRGPHTVDHAADVEAPPGARPPHHLVWTDAAGTQAKKRCSKCRGSGIIADPTQEYATLRCDECENGVVAHPRAPVDPKVLEAAWAAAQRHLKSAVDAAVAAGGRVVSNLHDEVVMEVPTDKRAAVEAAMRGAWEEGERETASLTLAREIRDYLRSPADSDANGRDLMTRAADELEGLWDEPRRLYYHERAELAAHRVECPERARAQADEIKRLGEKLRSADLKRITELKHTWSATADARDAQYRRAEEAQAKLARYRARFGEQQDIEEGK